MVDVDDIGKTELPIERSGMVKATLEVDDALLPPKAAIADSCSVGWPDGNSELQSMRHESAFTLWGTWSHHRRLFESRRLKPRVLFWPLWMMFLRNWSASSFIANARIWKIVWIMQCRTEKEKYRLKSHERKLSEEWDCISHSDSGNYHSLPLYDFRMRFRVEWTLWHSRAMRCAWLLSAQQTLPTRQNE